MNPVAAMVKQARRDAGLTQRQLALRLGVSQAAVAQLESPRANPTFATFERALGAAGCRVELRILPAEAHVDVTLLRAALAMRPVERIAAAERLIRDAESIAAAGARSRAPRRRRRTR